MKKSIVMFVFAALGFSSACNNVKSSEEKAVSNTIPTKNINYLEEGKKIALSTKAVLGKNLYSTIKNEGTEAAMSFCNANAISLSDSMSVLLNAKVKRVSDKNRNPANKANAEELEYINNVKASLELKESPKPKISEHDNKMIGYYPILTNNTCLQCHGSTEKDIEPKVLEKINLLYLNDLAVNYKLNGLRGIWVIAMDKK